MKTWLLQHKEPTTSTPSTSRLVLLDAVKILAMIMMMQGHTLDGLVRPTELDIYNLPWSIWHLMRGFTAPVFLTVSGMLFAITLKRNDQGQISKLLAWKRVRWALILMVIGYLMVFPANNIIHLFWVNADGWKMFFQTNILQLNAVTLALVTLTAYKTYSNKTLGIVSFAIAMFITLVTPFVNMSVNWFNFLPEGIAAFLSYAHGSIFPIFPFSSYMFFGVAAGTVLQRVPKEERFSYLKRNSWKVGLTLASIGGALAYGLPYIPLYPPHDFLLSSPATVFLRTAFVFFMISAVAVIYPIFRKQENTVALFGKQSLVIYVVHLVLLFGTPWFPSIGRIYFKSLTLETGILWAVAVVAATLAFVIIEDYIKNNAVRVARIIRISSAVLLAYALLL
ncbi:MAG: DUF1624 domain-containing protein [Candidatus Kapabacteria bacterium]|nr:DUF1624 domain-containing protein [Candidatus Kapabacteria bacterium]